MVEIEFHFFRRPQRAPRAIIVRRWEVVPRIGEVVSVGLYSGQINLIMWKDEEPDGTTEVRVVIWVTLSAVSAANLGFEAVHEPL